MNHNIRTVMRHALIVYAAYLSLLTSTSVHAQEIAPPATRPHMSELISAYAEDYHGTQYFFELPGSVKRLERLSAIDQDWGARLEKLDFDSLDHDSQLDCLLLDNLLKRHAFQRGRERKRLEATAELVGFATTVSALEQARWQSGAIDSPAAAAEINKLTETVKNLKRRVEAGIKPPSPANSTSVNPTPPSPAIPVIPLKPSQSDAIHAAQTVTRLRETMKRWFDYYDGYNPDFPWWLRQPYDAATKELEEYAKLLKEEVAGQKGKPEDHLVGEPVGAAALAEAIKLELIPYSADELVAIGERELAWGEAQTRQAAKEMGFDDWHEALNKVKSDFVPPGQQDRLVADIIRDATKFTESHSFATIPPLAKELWRLSMISPETLKTIPYAAYSSPQILVAYPKNEMPTDDKLMTMRGNNRSFTRLTTMHEMIPGHHLQNFQADRHHSYRQLFHTPFHSEGWALYCELRFWDLGWARTPEEKLGMLFWRQTRAARVILSLKFHLGQITPDEMVAFLVDKVGHEKFGATSEVRRFISDNYDPLYQAGYLLGGIQLQTLRGELAAPGKWSEQQFNDAVLEANSMPVELLRAHLRQQPIQRGFQSNWRFAD